MKVKNKIGLVLCSLVAFICLGSFTQAATTTITSWRNCYIRAAFPDTPIYGSGLAVSGTSGDECITFIIFNMGQGPWEGRYKKAELRLTFYYNVQTTLPAEIVIDVLNCTHTIDEDTLTWNTAPTPLGPKFGEIILTANELEDQNYVVKYFDITNFISGLERTEMTFVIATSEDVQIYIVQDQPNPPQIRYTVPDDIPSYNLFIILGLLGVLSVILYKKMQINRK